MTINDYLELAGLLLWIISLVGAGILGHFHLKNQRLQEFRDTAQTLMTNYVYFYDKSVMSNDKKLNNVVNAVVDGLRAKGFEVSKTDLQNIFAGVEHVVTDLRLKQKSKFV
ncbi:tRNA G26 N,N-dimethylase Trm1 [Lactobacillus colini]|uniref:tRNA G26 N,N-dimethylase Trm1 n=1 Tax=Lactobacillus colini TaxID=1819254 RepID=A0ABS4MCD4_9LACO|nr:helveticin [Lactobacillus colini]MBP2057345.1 tRNA G26 N,N-dimethylase Trm1 [Lactobacillus colini]